MCARAKQVQSKKSAVLYKREARGQHMHTRRSVTKNEYLRELVRPTAATNKHDSATQSVPPSVLPGPGILNLSDKGNERVGHQT